jgi:hypothetical protein
MVFVGGFHAALFAMWMAERDTSRETQACPLNYKPALETSVAQVAGLAHFLGIQAMLMG